MTSTHSTIYLFIAMDDDGFAHPTFCADQVAVEDAVRSAMYSLSPGVGLSAEEIETVEATAEELMEDGYIGFEGDPPLHLYKLRVGQ